MHDKLNFAATVVHQLYPEFETVLHPALDLTMDVHLDRKEMTLQRVYDCGSLSVAVIEVTIRSAEYGWGELNETVVVLLDKPKRTIKIYPTIADLEPTIVNRFLPDANIVSVGKRIHRLFSIEMSEFAHDLSNSIMFADGSGYEYSGGAAYNLPQDPDLTLIR